MNKENLAILTWNIGKDSENKLLNYKNELNEKLKENNNPKHLIICLQECNNNQKFNNLIINNYKLIDTKTVKSGGLINFPNNFALNILYFIKDGYSNKYTIHCNNNNYKCNKKSLSIKMTKYIQPIFIKKNENILFYIFNIHSVFEDIKKVDKSYNTIIKYINEFTKNNSNKPIFIVGDFNTRSMDLEGEKPQCYKKSVCTCSDNKCSNDKTYCYFDNRSVINIFRKFYKFNKINKINTIKSNIDKCINIQKGGDIIDNNLKEKLKNLIETDYLYYLMKNNKIFINYNEILIFFPPTYKICPDKLNENKYKYKYTQKKLKNGRLMGFPDRIIYKNDVKCLYYSSLPWFGNDHLPVLGIYLLYKKSNNRK